MEWGLLSQGLEASPVKLPQSFMEVASGAEKGEVLSPEVASGAEAFPPRPQCWRSRASGHSQVILRVMLTGHQEASVSLSWFCMPGFGGDRSSKQAELRLPDQGGLKCPFP